MGEHIMVVDDDQGSITSIRLVLERRMPRVKVTCASSGREALELMRRRVPDLVLLEIMMSEMDGWKVTQEMLSDNALKAVPIIYVTAKTDILSRQVGMVCAEGFITKPFEGDELIKIVMEVLARHEREGKP